MASPKPAVIVRREFEATPDVVTQQLRACIVGPSCQLVRYGVAAEKSKGFLASVTSLATEVSGTSKKFLSSDTTYPLSALSSLAYSSLLDSDYAKVFIEDAYLTYAQVTNGSTATAFTHTTTANYLTASGIGGSTSAWKNGNGTNRSAALVQDVAVGDIIQMYNGSYSLVHSSVVTGFTAEVVAATIGNPVAGTFSNTTITEGTSGTVSAGGLLFSYDTTNYFNADGNQAADPRIVGATSTTYTITITATKGSTIDFTVKSSTGLDDGAFTDVSAGTTVNLVSGLAISTPGNYNNLDLKGGEGSFTLNVGHLPRTVGSGQNVTSSGTFTGPASTTYILTCTKGGSLRAGVEFKVSTNNGSDINQSFTIQIAGAVAFTQPIGSYGLVFNLAATTQTGTTYTAGFVKGDTIRITCTAAGSGPIKTVVFADTKTFSGSNVVNYVRLSKKKTVELPKFSTSGAVNWQLLAADDSAVRSLKVSQVVDLFDSSINSGNSAASVTAGSIYLQYRAFQALVREVGSVNTMSDITTQLGTITPDNPLAYGVYKAWSNANGATVHYIPTVSQTLNGERGFADALALAKGNRNCYGLVPLTNSSEIWAAFVGHVNDESAPTAGRFRVLWIAPEIESHNKILDVDSNGVKLFAVTPTAVAGTTGRYYVDVVNSSGGAVAPKFTETVQVGDYLRSKFRLTSDGKTTYVEYKIVGIVDNDTLVISASTLPDLNNEAVEIYRDLSSNALANRYVQVAGGFSSERVFAVVPDRGVNGLRVDGSPVKNWYVACAFAGLRSGSRPQQPLSNVALTGFDGVNITPPQFNEADLDVLRDGGVWVVRNTDTGEIYSERQLSTSTIDIYRKEQSVTCNVDSISFSTSDALRQLVGRVNITPDTIALVRADLIGVLNSLSKTAGAVTVGPQLLSYEIGSIEVPATAKDTLTVKVTVTLPVPMNIIDITLVI